MKRVGFLLVPMLLYAKSIDVNVLSGAIAEIGAIATQERENIFYQPFIVSVYKGRELQKLGIVNLKEALSLVPGVDVTTDNLNNSIAIFRGSNPFAYGQSKLFIDGVLVNDVLFDSYSSFMDMPMELIKRIEVIRGPGGKLDAFNAYAGSIYVTTYAKRTMFDDTKGAFFVKYGSYEYKMGGVKRYFDYNGIKTFIDFYYQRDDKHLPTGYDILHTGLYGAINVPLSRKGEAPLWLKNYSLGFHTHYKDFSLQGRINSYKKGGAYGINYMLPRKRDFVKTPTTYIEAKYTPRFASLPLTIKLGAKWDSFHINERAGYPGLTIPKLGDPTQSITYPNGFFIDDIAKQRSLYHSLFARYRVDEHDIKFGYRIYQEKTYYQQTKTSDRDNPNNTVLVDYSHTYPFFDDHAKRYGYNVVVQDNVVVNEYLTLSFGVNYENNTHIPGTLNPRITVLYDVDGENLVKVMYSKSLRSPSWQELYAKNNRARIGNKNLRPEKVDAYEIDFIRRLGIDDYVQCNIFYLKNKDQINNINPLHQFQNTQNSDIYGVEVEVSKHFGQNWKLYGDYSYIYTRDDRGRYLPNVARHMLKGYVQRELTSFLDTSIKFLYVGRKKRYYFDPRAPLDGYTKIDWNLHYQKDGWGANFSIKNLFDTNIYYPSYPFTYEEDYKQEGRTYMISVEKLF